MKIFSLFHLFVIIISNCLFAQNGGLSGTVSDKSNREPLIGANVLITGTKFGAITNKSGYFAIPDIPPGTYTARFSYLGYETKQEQVIIKANTYTKISVTLAESSFLTDEVVVEADAIKERDKNISSVNLQAADLKKMPSIGEPDLLRSLQLIPGVQSLNELSAGLYIRGGSPDQNLILLDGITVYNPSHLFGFFSTFNSDAIKDVKLIKGGFPVEYGGRLTAVLDITNKEGDRNNYHTAGSVSVISSKLTVEGPWKYGSFMVSGRRTYLDLILKLSGEKDLPSYYFYDFNAKINVDEFEDNKFSFSTYLGSDVLDVTLKPKVGAEQKINLEWGNKTFSGKWTHVFSNSVYANLTLAATDFYSKTTAQLSPAFEVKFDNQIREYSAKGDLEWAVSSDHFLKFGGQLTQYRFLYNNEIGIIGTATDIVTKPKYSALYVQDEWRPDALWLVTSGIRYNYFSSGGRSVFEPRIQVKHFLDDKLALTGSIGYYAQYTTVVVNDVASFADLWFPIDETLSPQTAVQYIAGVEYNPSREYSFSVEGYYKPMKGLTEIKDGNQLNEEKLVNVFNTGTGYSSGLEFFLQKKTNSLTGWMGYTWSQTKRTFDAINYGREYPAKWDFTHNLSLTGNYDLQNSWVLGATFVFTTGTTYTVPTGYYRLGLPDRPRDYLRAGEKNAYRLEPYHRLDVSASKSWEGWGGQWRFSFSIYNLYNHRNVWYRDYQFGEPGEKPVITDVRLIPFLPTLELSFKF